MWLHFNKNDEFQGYSFPLWALTPIAVIMILLVGLLWPIIGPLYALYTYNEGKKAAAIALLVSVICWFLGACGGCK